MRKFWKVISRSYEVRSYEVKLIKNVGFTLNLVGVVDKCVEFCEGHIKVIGGRLRSNKSRMLDLHELKPGTVQK